MPLGCPVRECDIVYTMDGDVKGGHYVFKDPNKAKPFICPTKEMTAIKLLPEDVVCDIGAYTGEFAMIACRSGVKECRSYEPTPESYEVLKKYKNINLKIFNEAVVGDDTKLTKLYISKGIGVTNSLVASSAKKKEVEVACAKYDDIIKDCSVVKLDIEGGEYNIPQIIQDHIRVYIIDFHKIKFDKDELTWIERSNKIVDELESKGYKCIIKPDWANGWTQAGSWVKEDYDFAKYNLEANMKFKKGLICVDCNKDLDDGKDCLRLCPECSKRWKPKHRKEYQA